MDTNTIGDRGEIILMSRLMEFGKFTAYLLGGKVPAYDILAEIIPTSSDEKPYQFLLQVKTTGAKHPLTKDGKRIKTPVPQKKLQALIDHPLPTYIAGVDLNTENVYIAPAFDQNTRYTASIPTVFVLQNNPRENTNKQQLEKLKQDIIEFWTGLHVDEYKSIYKSSI